MRIRNLEEQIIVLYALHHCGGKGRKGRIVQLIIRDDLVKVREGDGEHRETGEVKIVNDFAWARQDLKQAGYLTMPQHGIWEITRAGQARLIKVARAAYEGKLDELPDFAFDRFSSELLKRLRELGRSAALQEMPGKDKNELGT